MKILGVDSSGNVASAAILNDTVLAGEYSINNGRTHSQTLMPMIEEVITMSGISPSELDAIAIASGPGSFTGLRIGSATVKGLGLALGKPVIPVPTLEGLAFNVFGTKAIICPIMDARRNQVYTGIYQFKEKKESPVLRPEDFNIIETQKPMDILQILEIINKLGKEVIFLGDGVPVYQTIILEEMKVPYSFAPAHMALQKAGSVAMLGSCYFAMGKTNTAAEFKPEYLRLSQAEREKRIASDPLEVASQLQKKRLL